MDQSRSQTPQRGRLTRWLFGEEAARRATVEAEVAAVTTDVIDIRSEIPDLETVSLRIERLETGMRLMADAMKRAYGDLSNSIRTLTYEIKGHERGGSNEGTNLQQSVASLNLMIDELLHSMRAFPHVLAAATDELSQRIEAVEERTTETLGEMLRKTDGNGAEPAEAGAKGA